MADAPPSPRLLAHRKIHTSATGLCVYLAGHSELSIVSCFPIAMLRPIRGLAQYMNWVVHEWGITVGGAFLQTRLVESLTPVYFVFFSTPAYIYHVTNPGDYIGRNCRVTVDEEPRRSDIDM